MPENKKSYSRTDIVFNQQSGPPQSELQAEQARMLQQIRADALSKLALGVAHEVKNPLAIMRFCLEVLEASLKESGHQKTITDMKAALKRIDRVISDLLECAAPRVSQERATSVKEIIDRSLVQVEPDLNSRNIRVNAQVPFDLPQLLVNQHQLEQIFIQLFRNAIDAMPGGGELTIHARTEGTTFVAEVQDTGPGIAPDVLPMIFDPFFTTKSAWQSTGLGLTIAHNLAKLHQGHLEVRNCTPHGVLATLRLPVLEAGNVL
jgi:signal transduction histidine kinase